MINDCELNSKATRTRTLAIANKCASASRQESKSSLIQRPLSFGPISTNCHVEFGICKKLSCRREAARRSVSLKILLSY